MIYLGWYDDSLKKSVIVKIDEAIERYEAKYGVSPNTCLVSPLEMAEHPRIKVAPASWLRPGYYYVGVAPVVEQAAVATAKGIPAEVAGQIPLL